MIVSTITWDVDAWMTIHHTLKKTICPWKSFTINLHRNLNQYTNISIQENAFENVCKMVAILSRPYCVKSFYVLTKPVMCLVLQVLQWHRATLDAGETWSSWGGRRPWIQGPTQVKGEMDGPLYMLDLLISFDLSYCKISNIRHTKSSNLNVSRLAVVFVQFNEARC